MLRRNKNIAMHKKSVYIAIIHERAGFLSKPQPPKGWKMTKTRTADTIENVEFPSFDASKATDQIRAFAEKGDRKSVV